MMNNRFEYKKEERDGVIIFTLIGSFDIGTVSAMKADIDLVFSSGQYKVLFDLYDLEQIDSSGIGAIIALFKRVRSNKGDVKISRLMGQPKEIFSLLRLDRVFEILKQNSEAAITINGYSDSIGSAAYNNMISEIRANAVKSYLIAKGVAPARMTAFGHGSQKFIGSNKTEQGRRLNRRVEIELNNLIIESDMNLIVVECANYEIETRHIIQPYAEPM